MGKKGVHAHRWLTAGAIELCRLCGTVDREQVFSYVSRAVGSGGGVQLSLCLCFVVSMQNLESSTRKLRPYRRRRITLGQGRAHMLPSRKTQAAHGTPRQMRQENCSPDPVRGRDRVEENDHNITKHCTLGCGVGSVPRIRNRNPCLLNFWPRDPRRVLPVWHTAGAEVGMGWGGWGGCV